MARVNFWMVGSGRKWPRRRAAVSPSGWRPDRPDRGSRAWDRRMLCKGTESAVDAAATLLCVYVTHRMTCTYCPEAADRRLTDHARRLSAALPIHCLAFIAKFVMTDCLIAYCATVHLRTRLGAAGGVSQRTHVHTREGAQAAQCYADTLFLIHTHTRTHTHTWYTHSVHIQYTTHTKHT